jgi:hypothetical protein
MALSDSITESSADRSPINKILALYSKFVLKLDFPRSNHKYHQCLCYNIDGINNILQNSTR